MMTAPEPDGIVWHTSSYTYENGACIEVGWRTSSYSYDNGGRACAGRRPGTRLQGPPRPRLTIPTITWHTFLATLTR